MLSPPMNMGAASLAEMFVVAVIAAVATSEPCTNQYSLVAIRTTTMCCQVPHTAVYVEVAEPVGYTSSDVPADLSSIESKVVQQPIEKGCTAANIRARVSGHAVGGCEHL